MHDGNRSRQADLPRALVTGRVPGIGALAGVQRPPRPHRPGVPRPYRLGVGGRDTPGHDGDGVSVSASSPILMRRPHRPGVGGGDTPGHDGEGVFGSTPSLILMRMERGGESVFGFIALSLPQGHRDVQDLAHAATPPRPHV